MNAKQFFKSTSFKCIAVLLAILIVCGVILTICNSLFYVSAAERLARTLTKLYGVEIAADAIHEEEIDGDVIKDLSDCEISHIYTIDGYDEQYVVDVTGKGGYGGGTVTLGVIVQIEDNTAKIKSAVISSNKGQSFIAKIGAGDIKKLINKQDDEAFTSFNTTGIVTGATYSMGAVANALNGAYTYINTKYCGYTSQFAGYAFTDKIDADACSVTVSGDEITYNLVTLGNGYPRPFKVTVTVDQTKTVKTFTIAEDGNGSTADRFGSIAESNVEQFIDKDLDYFKSVIGEDGLTDAKDAYESNSLTTGATRSTYLCLCAAAFAVANYDLALAQFGQGGTN